MKQLLRFFPFTLVLFLFSCTIREELEIKADGSGKLTVRNDMSALMEMAKSMDPDGKFTKDGNFTRKIDSTIYMKALLDTVKEVDAEKKALLRDGKLHVQVHGSEGLAKMNFEVPYKDNAQLQGLYNSVFNNSASFLGLLQSMQKTKNDNLPPAEEIGEKISGLTSIGSIYDVSVKEGVYSRKVNKERFEKYKQKQNNSSSDEMKGMAQMFGAIEYTIAIKFPRPVKKFNAKKAELSTDKLNVLLKGDLMDMTENPQNMELEVEY
jgi:hypothetical protein